MSGNTMLRKSWLALSAALLFAPQGAALAQQAADATVPVQPVREEEATQLDAVEVTGSRIKRVDFENSQPVVSVSREDIERSGITSLGDALSKLSVAGSALNTNVNNGGSGSVFVDLRSLGPARTLVLVNGRRWVNDAGSLGNSVDFSTIPLSIVERVDVLKDGASSIYGSDAIAGVINVITRKDYSGVRASSQIGEFGDKDGRIHSHSLTVGTIGDKTSAAVDLSYTQAEPVFAADRAISAVPVFGVPGSDSRVGSSTNPFGRFLGLQTGGSANASSDDLTLDRASTAASRTYRDFNGRQDGYNFATANYLVTPSERTGFFANVRHELSYELAFTAEALYQKRKSEQLLAPTPLVLGGAFGDDTVIDADAPGNIFDIDIGDDPDGIEGVSRRLIETGGRLFSQDVQTYHLGAGFNGSFDLMGRSIFWDIGYGLNQSVNNAITRGQVNLDRVQTAVSGPGCTGSCVGLDVFGPPGAITQAMLDYILITEQSRFEQESRAYTINFSGEWFQLPAGSLAFAVGGEKRREFGQDIPDALVASGATSGNARLPTMGEFDLEEYYTELAVPLLAGYPYVEKLDLSLSSRTSRYDIQGDIKNVTKGAAGLQYRPIPNLLARVSFAEGFRAPSITELFAGRADSFPQVSDPCAVPNPNQNCINDGVPAGGYTQANSQIRTTVGGEPNLEPEESESVIYGLVYDPEAIPGLSLSLDIYKYELENAISSIDAQSVLDGCAATGEARFCGNTTRAGSGVITQLIATNINIGGATVEGADFHAKYTWPEIFQGSLGSFVSNLDLTYLEEYSQFGQDPDDKQVLTGRLAGDITTIGGTALPRLKGNMSLAWVRGQMGGSWTVRYTKEQQENCSRLARAPEFRSQYCVMGVNQDGVAAFQHYVGSATYHDVQFSYSLPSYQAEITVGVNNLFDRDPPISYSAFANSYDSRTYDVPGVFPYARMTVDFE